MAFQFAFSNKYELIYVGNNSYQEPLGNLIRQLVDVDWSELKAEMRKEIRKDQEETILMERLRELLNDRFFHPVLLRLVQEINDDANYAEVLFGRVSRLELGCKIVSQILETLVKEEKDAYEETLFRLLACNCDEGMKRYCDAVGCVKMLSVTERNKPLFQVKDDFHYIFDTEDLMAIILQELQYLCSNSFYIRKCALCKKFMWTRKLNKIYCDRKFTETTKKCSQIGPTKNWRENNPQAYALYWVYRKRLSNRATNVAEKNAYQQWLSQTEGYKDLARKNMIPVEEMKLALDAIELEVYGCVVYL